MKKKKKLEKHELLQKRKVHSKKKKFMSFSD